MIPDKIDVNQYKAMFGKSKSNKGYRALGRMKAGKMNATEKRYAGLLGQQMISGAIINYWFEAINLRLGDNCFYKPDFLILNSNSELEIHEVKGFWTDDARVKIKVAADKFPFVFKAVKYVKKEWEYEYF